MIDEVIDGVMKRFRRILINRKIQGLVYPDILDGKKVIRIEGQGGIIPGMPYDPILTKHFPGKEWTAWYDNIEKLS